jgi:NitT/TauT family transport system permease protein
VLPRTDDAAMPHVWTVLSRLVEPDVAGAAAARPVGLAVAAGALFTLGLALGGLVLGGVFGVLLALVMQRFGLLERAVLPYVVASQTVPLIAIAPLVAGWGGRIAILGWPWQPWASVMVISSYLSFFPIAVGMLRGLDSPQRADVELFRTLAAGWWTTLLRLRLPASVPHLVPAVRLAAAASVVGAIVAEISTGTRGGIGRLIIEYAQSATGDPSRLYTAILGAAVLGLVAAGAVGLLDVGLRRYRGSVR